MLWFGRSLSKDLRDEIQKPMPTQAKIFITITAALGATVLASSFLHWHSDDLLRFGCYLLIAVLASTMKVTLPGIEGTMSVHFLFVLLGVMELSLTETLVIGCAAALLQCLWKPKRRPEPAKVLFNVFGMTANAIYVTYFAYHLSAGALKKSLPLMIGAAACAYFLSNTLPVA